MCPSFPRRPALVLVVLTLLAVAACGQSPDGRLPTTPSSAWPAVNGVALPGMLTAADLGACLSSRRSACLAAPRIAAADVAGAAGTSPPLNVTATVTGSTVVLVWTAPTLQDAPVLGYVIDVGSSANFVMPNLASLDTGNAATSLTAPLVPPGTYYVRVRARNAVGFSAPSNEIQVVVGTVTTPGTSCPGAPRSLSGNVAAGTVSLTWLPPLSGTTQWYIIEAGAAAGLANLANFNTGTTTTTFAQPGVPAGVYYVRVRAAAAGCAASAPANEVIVTVGGSAITPGNPLVTLRLTYFCSGCTGDPDNYALNVDCAAGRCTTFRSSNPRSSGVITATLRMASGVHNVEVVVANASSPWSLTFSVTPPGSGGVVPGSFKRIFPATGPGLNFASCQVTGTAVESFFEFSVSGPGSPTC